MDNSKVFQDRNIIGICEHISKYCEVYINLPSTPSAQHLRSFHTFLPTLLVYIFGSPTTRGWIQTETQPKQDDAIRNLLSVHGRFFQALMKSSLYPEYSYDLVTESLPADVRKVLSAGAIHLLPRVYKDCSYLNSPTTSNSIDIRAAATRQSTLLSSAMGGDRRIKFNMLQFYLYYFASVPTWPPLTPPPQQPSSINTTFANLTRGSTASAPTTNTYNNLLPTRQYQYGTVRSTSPTSVNNNNTNITPPYLVPGKLRSVMDSVYSVILDEYMNQFIPISTSKVFPMMIDSFFVDALVELWIRTPWISTGQKLSAEYMHYISTFIRYIVRHDLKQCLGNEDSLLYQVYALVKDEIYMLISRLALNWSKNDDYLEVVDLWSIWAAAWKMGVPPRSLEKEEYIPIAYGWAPFILDNIPFYISLVDILLQRCSTFQFKDGGKPQIQPVQTSTVTSSYNESGTIRGQLRIVYRLINVLKAQGLVDFLGLVENGLEKINAVTMVSVLPNNENPFKTLALQSFGNDKMDYVVQDKLRVAYNILLQLDGGMGNVWKPKGLYTETIQPRSAPLLKTLAAIHNEALIRDDPKSIMPNGTAPNKSAQKAHQLKEAYDLLYITFKVTGTAHLTPSNLTTTSSITTQPKVEPFDRNAIKNRFISYREGDKLGFLSKEDILAIRQGKAMCSTSNIHALGIRAKQFVRSNEIALLVRLTLLIDERLNYYYNLYLPNKNKYRFLPDELTVRPIATTVNLVYILAMLFIVLYLLYLIIF